MKVVGATDDETTETEDAPSGGRPPRTRRNRAGGDRTARSARSARSDRPAGADRPAPTRRAFRLVSIVAIVGLLGTIVFGTLYVTKSSGGGPTQDQAVIGASRAFLTDFFNFNAKTVDSDFNAVTGMATGAFSTQAQHFFNTSIRKA
ncbi:MAG TPA: hypothetical protein VHD39_02375, partial [Acidimicrobiales bacterium]|nr:hypothetical protein [Acidimicrobiales bacterium]